MPWDVQRDALLGAGAMLERDAQQDGLVLGREWLQPAGCLAPTVLRGWDAVAPPSVGQGVATGSIPYTPAQGMGSRGARHVGCNHARPESLLNRT